MTPKVVTVVAQGLSTITGRVRETVVIGLTPPTTVCCVTSYWIWKKSSGWSLVVSLMPSIFVVIWSEMSFTFTVTSFVCRMVVVMVSVAVAPGSTYA